jgi:hypothetical protein
MDAPSLRSGVAYVGLTDKGHGENTQLMRFPAVSSTSGCRASPSHSTMAGLRQ